MRLVTSRLPSSCAAPSSCLAASSIWVCQERCPTAGQPPAPPCLPLRGGSNSPAPRWPCSLRKALDPHWTPLVDHFLAGTPAPIKNFYRAFCQAPIVTQSRTLKTHSLRYSRSLVGKGRVPVSPEGGEGCLFSHSIFFHLSTDQARSCLAFKIRDQACSACCDHSVASCLLTSDC